MTLRSLVSSSRLQNKIGTRWGMCMRLLKMANVHVSRNELVLQVQT